MRYIQIRRSLTFKRDGTCSEMTNGVCFSERNETTRGKLYVWRLRLVKHNTLDSKQHF